MTKKQEQLLDNYNRASATELRQVYNSWSDKKERAFKECIEKMSAYEGYDGRICSANTWMFTYAFKYRDGYGHTCLCYITPSTDYEFIIR